MSDILEEENHDGLECFKFQLFLDDYISSSHRKSSQSFYSAAKPREKVSMLTNSERRASLFENSPGEIKPPNESTFRKVYELLNEQDSKEVALTASDKKHKKGPKNLTPETNYTQKESDREEDVKTTKSRSHRKDFNIWGSYKKSKGDDIHSRKTLTAYSEAYEPDFTSTCKEKQDTSMFDLDLLKLVRAPKKNSMALPAGGIDLMQSLRAGPRKLSFQQDRSIDIHRDLSLGFVPKEKHQKTRFSRYMKPQLSEALSSLEKQIDALIVQQSGQEFPTLVSHQTN